MIRYVKLVRLKGFEPLTYRLGGDCSIQLSYRRIRTSIITKAFFITNRGVDQLKQEKEANSHFTRLTWRHVPEHLASGGMLAYPTDTLWGLGCRADDADLCKRCLGLKGEKRQPVASVIMTPNMLSRFVHVPAEVDEFFPGPYTLVLPLKVSGFEHIASSDGFLGCRIPARPALIEAVGILDIPLVTTSLNRSGHAPACTFEDSEALAKRWGIGVVDEGAVLSGASTILKWDPPNWTLLRKGVGRIPVQIKWDPIS